MWNLLEHITENFTRLSHLSDLFECLGIHVRKNVALGKRQDLECHGAVMVLQGRYVVVAHR